MPRVRDLLYRFRPSGTPGAASAAAVPVDRRADRAHELEPLFARLEPTARHCVEIVEQARRDAAVSRDQAHERVEALLSVAAQRAETERAAAAARVGREAAQATATSRRVAERDAAQVRERSAQQMTALVGRVVADVRTLLAGAPASDDARAGAR